ncbi:DUF3995 domain-containing protein [Jatrophihabitans sp. DSM 45814]
MTNGLTRPTTEHWQANPAALLAAVWTGVFAGLHIYWAAGGGARYAIDLIAIPACLTGAVLAWRLARDPYRRWLFVVAAGGSSLMLWHAVLNYFFLAIRCAIGQPLTTDDRYYAFLYEPFWALGGVLWLLAVLHFRAGRPLRAMNQPISQADRQPFVAC